MTTTTLYTMPTVHMNGTSLADLREGYDNANDALQSFKDAFNAITHNARDYYVQGPEAWAQASEERELIYDALRKVTDYIDEHRVHLYDIAS